MISGIPFEQNLSDFLEKSFRNLLPSVISGVFPDDGAKMSFLSVIPCVFPDDDPENRFPSGKQVMFPDDKFRRRAGGFGLRIVLGCVGLE